LDFGRWASSYDSPLTTYHFPPVPHHYFTSLREAQALSLARSLHSLKPQRYRNSKIAKEYWFSLFVSLSPPVAASLEFHREVAAFVRLDCSTISIIANRLVEAGKNTKNKA
jgi:hypothetical protein